VNQIYTGSPLPARNFPEHVYDQGVLIVDDSFTQRRGLERQLRSLGVERLAHAGDGQDALILLDQLPRLPAVIFLDLELPRLDGIEVLQHLSRRSECPEVVLVSSSDEVLISAVAAMAEAMGIRLLGAHRKPLAMSDLAQMLARAGRPCAKAKPDPLNCPTTRRLAQAIELGEIQPFYQPKLALHGARLVGFEVLARWINADGQIHSPADFIPLAEETGLIQALTLSLMEQALGHLCHWRERGFHTHLAINLSAHCLSRTGCADEIMARVAEAGVSPDQISFEITETALVMDMPAALATISRLRLRGFGFSIDDYGTGFSSLQQLARFPFTELKIDRCFVQGATSQRHVREILRSAIDLGRQMGIASVAEGVETQDQLDLLRELGCCQVQGYLFSPPRAAPAVLDWVNGQLADALLLCQGTGRQSLTRVVFTFSSMTDVSVSPVA
jgi:EAL domain-containing protein (putative c-di-GMP-specific phosphodiesterase class I)/ActR/RegA family two-component response regulator